MTTNTPTRPRSLAEAAALRGDVTLIVLIGVAHGMSHFSQLLLAPLFPWLKDAFAIGYQELGFVLTVFFVVSCGVQAMSGFVVDRFSPRPVLFGGLAMLAGGAFLYSVAQNYWMLLAGAVVGGIGNGVFHPVDYTLFNRRVAPTRLGHAYSVHGVSGSLGWALAPIFVVPLAAAYSWRVAMAAAGVLTLVVLAVLVWQRGHLVLSRSEVKQATGHGAATANGGFDFLRIPAVWMCFGFFFFYAAAISAVQAFAPEAARQLHGVPVAMAAMCLTIFMTASAGGMVVGGFLASDPKRCERVVASGFGVAACLAISMATMNMSATTVLAIFGLMGFAAGTAGPSRDMLVKKSTPENATGRVYGVVYAGLDIGQAAAPLLFGLLMDRGEFRGVLLGLAAVQAVLIVSAFNVRRARRTLLVAAA